MALTRQRPKNGKSRSVLPALAMPEQAAQAAPQGTGLGVWANRLFIGLCLYVLVFGNPLKPSAPEPVAPAAYPNGTPIDTPATPTPAAPQSKSGKHTPLLLPGAKLVRSLVEFVLSHPSIRSVALFHALKLTPLMSIMPSFPSRT